HGRMKPNRDYVPLNVEIAVRDCDGGVAQVPGHDVESHDRSPLLIPLFEEGDPVSGVDPGRLRQALRAQVIEAGQLAGVRVEQGSRPHQGGQQAGSGKEQDPAPPAMPAWPPLSPAPDGSLTHWSDR